MQTHIRLAAVTAAALVLPAAAASADVLAQYSFETDAPTVDPLMADASDAAVVASDITLSDVVLNPPGNASPTATDGDEALAVVYASIDNDEDPDEDFLEFTLSSAGTLDFDSFTFDAAGQGDGTAQGFFRLFVDDGSGLTPAGATVATTGNNTYESFSYDLSGVADASSVTFRLAFADGGGGNPTNTLEIDNIVVNGTVGVIPEPASALAAAAGLGLLGLRRRR